MATIPIATGKANAIEDVEFNKTQAKKPPKKNTIPP